MAKDRSANDKTLSVPFRTQPWEVEKALPDRLKKEMDMVAQNSQLLAIELAHKAAYRSGLGRSMYCPPFAFKKLNSDVLQVRLTREELVSSYRTNLSLLQPGLVVGGVSAVDIQRDSLADSTPNTYIPRISSRTLSPSHGWRSSVSASITMSSPISAPKLSLLQPVSDWASVCTRGLHAV